MLPLKPPFFIIGNPRSGTTLLRLMLDSHRDLLVPPECGFAVWWHEKYRGWSEASCADGTLDPFLADLATSRKIETWGLDFDVLRDLIAAERPASYAELASLVYVFYGRSTGRTFVRWGDKNNFHVTRVDLIARIFPESHFIHIVRDGRDVACSYRRLAGMNLRSEYAPRLPAELPEIAREWRSNLDAAIASFDAIGWSRVHELRYEDLVSRPAAELERVCAFLGETSDGGMLDYHTGVSSRRHEPEAFLAWKGRVQEPPDASEVGKHLREMSAEELAAFEEVTHDLLTRYGYAPSA
jgi:hypothetical protein